MSEYIIHISQNQSEFSLLARVWSDLQLNKHIGRDL